MALFQPKWMSKNPARRQAAVARITNQVKLAAIMNESVFHDTQLQAAQQLTDPFQIKKLADLFSKSGSGHSVEIVDVLAGKITDPMLLLELAGRYRNEPFTQCSDKWIDRAIETGNEEVYIECLVKGYREELHKQLFAKLSKRQLVEVAKKANSYIVTQKAVNEISDASELKGMATNDELDTRVRVHIIERLYELGKEETARQALVSWFRNASYIVYSIIEHLCNTELLTELALTCDDPKTCMVIYEKLPGKVAGVIPNLDKLLSGKKDARREAAVNLIRLLSKDEMSAKIFWRHLKKAKGTGHTDSVKKGAHNDTGPKFTYKGVVFIEIAMLMRNVMNIPILA